MTMTPLLKSTMKQIPYCQKSGMQSIPVGLGLFSMAWMANTLNKKVECYNQYGLTSYLASCSTSLSTRKTYLATTFKSNLKQKEFGSIIHASWILPVSDRVLKAHNYLPSHLLIATSLWISQSFEKKSEEVSTDSVRIVPNSYIWAESFVNGVSLNKGDSFSYGQQNNDSLDDLTIDNETTISKLGAFKISRDYVSSDSSEGFEDWSFLDQKRPYDSLVRENIFELLEDLELGISSPISSLRLPLNTKEGSSFNVGLSKEGSFASERVAFEEHLFSSEINKTYTNRLRLEQRIKNFYGLSNLSINSVNQKKGDSSSYDTLLQIEKRIDVQLFRLKWVSSISHARQILKHKHIGIINYKDRAGYQKNINEMANVAASNLFLKAGDLLYWRNKDISTSYAQQLGYTEGTSVSNLTPNYENLHKFPWFGYISDTIGSKGSSEHEVFDWKAKVPEEKKASCVFALGSDYGSVSLSNDMNQLLTTLPLTVGVQEIVESASFGTPKEAAKKTFVNKQLGGYTTRPNTKGIQLAFSLQKVSKYFETHYKYAYTIRTNQDLKLEYLRLPQSSIQKNEWKAFLESSI